MKLTQEVKDKWVAALRSGEYKQGKQYLAIEQPEGASFCCLGVLCDVVKVPYHCVESDNHEVRRYMFGEGTESRMYLVGEISYQMALVYREGEDVDIMHELALLNDRGELDFNDIAAFIEANVGVSE